MSNTTEEDLKAFKNHLNKNIDIKYFFYNFPIVGIYSNESQFGNLYPIQGRRPKRIKHGTKLPNLPWRNHFTRQM